MFFLRRTIRSQLILLILLLCATVMGDTVFAQQRRGRGRRQQDDAQTDAQANATTWISKETVPRLWELNHETQLDARPFMDRATVSPMVSAKIARYAERILEKYDKNGNGVLEPEEWQGPHGMKGAPQSIDLDGNFILTLEEITAHIVRFGEGRTIHYPYPQRQLANVSETPELSDSDVFRPLSSPSQIQTTAQTANPLFGRDLSLEDIETEETAEENDEKTTADLPGNLPSPSEKKYYTPTEGLPAWFVQRDLNGDGQLSLIEFAPTLSQKGIADFGKLDKNGDGFITPDEIPRNMR